MFALFVCEPHYCGPGGDAFLLIHRPGADRPEALDGAGAVPARLTTEALAADGHERIPGFGGPSVTVPGAPSLLTDALARWGTRTLADVVAPAHALAADGFDARPTLAAASTSAAKRLAADDVLGPLFLPGGRPLAVGDRVTNESLAVFLDRPATEGSDCVYRGDIADDIAARVARAGGYLTTADLAAHTTDPVTPSSTAFAGAQVWQLPKPTQGPAVLHALDLLGDHEPDDWKAVADAITAGLLSVGVDLVRAPWKARQRGTSHLAVVDGAGGVASMITSVFAPFGSGVGVAGLGGALQNRAAGFLLLNQPPRPGKPPHTIIPGLVTRNGTPELAVGVAGGLMQAQGQVQLLVRLLAGDEQPQAAVDAPRFRVVDGGALALEAGHPLGAKHPDGLERPPGDGGFGCGQVAMRRDGTVSAAGDARRGGASEVVEV